MLRVLLLKYRGAPHPMNVPSEPCIVVHIMFNSRACFPPYWVRVGLAFGLVPNFQPAAFNPPSDGLRYDLHSPFEQLAAG